LSSLLIRADANVQIGTGHVMRCLALAQAWLGHTSNTTAVFAMNSVIPALVKRLDDEGIRVEHLSAPSGSKADASATANLAIAFSSEWIVVDGYAFGAEYQKVLKDAGLKLLLIDDYGHAQHYYCDLLLNENINPRDDWYRRRESYTVLLLGTRYAMLRREFWKWAGWSREVRTRASRVLVTMGGADPADVTGLVLEALELLPLENLEARVVVGAANPHHQRMSERVARSEGKVELLTAITNMPEMMAWADVAVSAAGTTLWELLFMQLPTIAVAIAENQRSSALGLGEMGAVQTLELSTLRASSLAAGIQSLMHSVDLRHGMAQGGTQIVDGHGTERVVKAMNGTREMVLRRAGAEHCRLWWEWANDPDVRRVSFVQDPIPWETHVQWFAERLRDNNSLLFVGLDDDVPVGQLRYDLDGNEAAVSVSLDRAMRDKGYGSRLIALGSQRVFESTGVELIHAYIKPGNRVSARAFVSAGYEPRGSSSIHGEEALHFVHTKVKDHR
jgi:UDP-2,4-diacetamido-2,4,6-trideoxy-beta-L-altropyranose hydrolase